MSRATDVIGHLWARLTSRGGRTAGSVGVDPTDAVAFEEVVRRSFQESMGVDPGRGSLGTGLPTDAQQASDPALAGESRASTWHGTRRESSSVGPSALSARAPVGGRPEVEVVATDAEAIRGDTDTGTRNAAGAGSATNDSAEPSGRRSAGDTAPEALLRTPSRVTPVADEFFDGLTKRVEGDR